MNVQEFISSGILEAYVLGDVTASERAEVERALASHPEVRDELRVVEETLLQVVSAGAVAPRRELKDIMMTKISSARQERKVVAMAPDRRLWKYAAAASIAFALIASYFALYYRELWKDASIALNEIVSQNREMAENYNVVNEKLDKLQGDLAIVENAAFTKVVMTGTLNDKNALASVYWNPKSEEVYVSIQQLKAIARENQFQLWAIVDGKPVDVGVFDIDFEGLLKMKNVKNAAAFAVTVEPRGGSSSPTLGSMQVVGSVHLSPS